MITINVPFTRVRRIVQAADFHIRLFKRHEEYRECFETFYKQLRTSDLSDTVIVLCGDIVHSKTDLSPEMVELASEFLSRCALLAPTIVIAGNHDMNMANSNRLDALSPIVANINNPNLHYLKHSGIYRCQNVDFYVCSIIGEQAEWPSPQIDDRIKIALFHGPVHNAKTDVGYTISSRHVMIETFDGFDMVLMGDIHRHQVLQRREPGKPIIVYPSSFIQQNHGETRTGHGWCDWDVDTGEFKFVELPNTYGYYTLEITNSGIPDWTDMPKNVYLRVFAGSLSQAEIKELLSQIRAQRTIREASISNFEGAKRLDPGSSANALLDIFDVNVQNKIIVDYLLEAMPSISADALERVLALNKAKNEEISAEDLARKIVWRPLTLKYDNLFTYGEGNSIDFKNLNGLLGIFAPNASGKTSIAEAICFALYDRTPRTQKASSIMNTRTSKCYCEFRFEVEDIEYVIERKGSKNKKGEVKIDVDFYKLVDGKKVSLNGEDRRYTNHNIRSYVGDFEDFLLTTFSSSSQQGLFVDRGQSDRKDLLSQFMGLTIFDKLHTRANDESKELAGALKRFKNDDFSQALADTRADIERHATIHGDKQAELDAVNTVLNKYTEDIQRLYEQKTPLTIKGDIYDLNARSGKLVEDLMIERNKIDGHTSQLECLRLKLDKGKIKIDELIASGIEASYALWQKLKAVSNEKRQLQEYRRKDLILVTQQITDLQEHKYDPNCSFCVTNGQHSIRSMEKAQAKMATVSTQIADLEQEINKLETELSQLPSDIEDRYQKFVAGRQWIAKTETEIAQAETTVERATGRIQHIKSLKETADREIAEWHSQQDIREQNNKIEASIQVLETEKQVHKKQFNELAASIQKAMAMVAVLQEREKEMVAKILEAEELEARYEAYEAYLAAVCRDGLPYKLISEILPSLEGAVNNFLSQMVQFTLIFDTDGKNINMKIRYDDERIWPLELASGMEKFISSLAIRVALTSLSSLPKSNFLIIDEGLGTLDQDNLSSMFMLFNVLRTKFDFIMLISHVDEVRDMADSLVEIQRTPDGFSKIQVQ